MNFIKKKLKGHKKDDEEEEYEKAVCEQSLHGHTGEQRMKNTEEWQFFQQLSSKVQETVQKTQTSLSKLKDNRLDNLDNPDIPENFDTSFTFPDTEQTTRGFMEDDKSVPFGNPKPTRAPPRPPPPAAEKAWVAVESDTEFDFAQSSASKGPPRPPPPSTDKVSNFQFSSDVSALHGSVTKSASPARPPPPTTVKPSLQTDDDLSFFSQPVAPPTETKQSLSLLEEFGFQTEVPAPSAAQSSFQDLLFLEEKEEIDPFDTSFVDVASISSKQDKSAKESEDPDQNFNPFSSLTDFTATTHSHSNGQSEFMKSSNKAVTNPFFVESVSETQKGDQNQDLITQQWLSLNPFSESKPLETTNVSNTDLLGDVFITSSNKDVIIGDTFHKNEQSLMASLKRDSADDVFSSVSDQKESEMLNLDSSTQSGILSDVFATSEGSSTDGIKQPWSLDNELDLKPVKEEKQSQPNYFDDLSDLADTTIVWDSDAPKQEEPVPVASTVLNGQAQDEKEQKDECEPVNGIEEQKPVTDSISVLDDFFGSDTVTTSQSGPAVSADPFEGLADLPCDTQTELKSPPELVQHPVSDEVVSSLDFSATDTGGKKDEDVFGATSEVKETEESSELKDIIADIDTAEANLTAGVLTPEPASLETASYSDETVSQPFDSGDQFSAFTFKVQKGTEKPDLDFDAFAAKFESAKDNQESDPFDAFLSKKAPTLKNIQESNMGFGSMDEFDPFKVTTKAVTETPPALKKETSRDSFEEYDNEGSDFSVVIKPKVKDIGGKELLTTEAPKLLPPPPKTPTKAFDTSAPRFNPFDKDYVEGSEQASQLAKESEPTEPEEEIIPALGEAGVRKSDSQESPLSPLFDEDTSQPLEPFPKPPAKEGWDMVLRQPNKKKLTGNRFWKKIFVKLSDNSVLQLFNKQDDKLPFQELPLQVSDNILAIRFCSPVLHLPLLQFLSNMVNSCN